MTIAVNWDVKHQTKQTNQIHACFVFRYIRWAEETFPKGGKGSNLATILERCVHLFKDEEKYRNDERYIYAWIKTVSFTELF